MRFVIVGLGLACALAHAQIQRPAFEVTSVKPHKSGSGYAALSCSNGRFISRGAPLTNTIEWAYDLPFHQFIEMEERVPRWVAEEAFDIEATGGGPVPESQCRLMLQSLLAERFKMAVHRDTKEGRVYELVMARGGHKLQRVTDRDKGLGVYITENGRLGEYAPGVEPARGLTLPQLARKLSLMTSRVPVHDNTGLEGMYKINLRFSTRSGVSADSDPDLLTAVQQQLGLRLEEHKGPVEMFVVDRISRPDAD